MSTVALSDLSHPHLPLVFDSEAKQAVATSYQSLTDLLLKPSECIYGIHTHFGANVADSLDPTHWVTTQRGLLEYLQVGIGELLPDTVVRRALRLQAIKTSKGFSGVHPDTWMRLIELSNSNHMPSVPCYGSLGASGDLVPMAHAVAPIFEGYDPKSPRDVLALVNTNSIMSSLACELQGECLEVLALGQRLTALTSLALGRDDFDCFGEGLEVNQLLRSHFSAGEQILRHRQEIRSTISGEPKAIVDALLQPRYSVRCAPQVFGNATDLLSFAQSKILEEAFSVSDNPIILPARDQGDARMWHGGLFYSAGLSTAADLMLDVVHRVCELSDRQTFLLVDSSLSGGLSNNLALSAADHLKGIHQLSNSLMQTLRSHTTPSRTLSTPAEGYNQDIVPGSMTALLQLQRALRIGRDVLRCSHFIAERGVHFRYEMPVPERLRLRKWSEYSVV